MIDEIKVDIPDFEARKTIIEDFRHNIFVEAGAGAGKTTELIKRLINQLRTGNKEIEQIVVITFTKKAASELRIRFEEELKKSVISGNDERLRKALNNIDKIYIGTIHSFCSKLLNQNPFESGLGFDFREVEEDEEEVIRERFWKQYTENVERDADIKEIRGMGFGPSELYTTFAKLCQYNDVKAEEVNANINLDTCTNELKEVLKRTCDEIDMYPSFVYKRYVDLQGEIIKFNEIPSKNISLKDLAGITKKYAAATDCLTSDSNLVLMIQDTKIKKVTEEKQEDHVESLKEIYRNFNGLYDGIYNYIYSRIMIFMKNAVEEYARYKKNQGVIGFSDLLIRTRDLLRNNQRVRKEYRNIYKAYYVDEFQDTDPIQAEMLSYLVGDFTDADKVKEWTKVKLDHGALFVVGDPKQAIYRFRRADIDTYSLVKKIIQEQGGTAVNLTTNFRSNIGIINWVNNIFGDKDMGLFKKDAEYQAEFVCMNDRENSCKDSKRICKYIAEGSTKQDIINADAVTVANIVSNILSVKESPIEIAKDVYLDEKIKPSEIMILTRNAKDTSVYLECLQSKGINVNYTGEVRLVDSLQVRKLIKVLKVLKDPTYEIHLVAALENVFNIDHMELLTYKKDILGGKRISIFREINNEGSVTSHLQIDSALNKLHKYYTYKNLYNNPLALSYHIAEDLALIEEALADKNDKSSINRLYQFFESMGSEDGSGKGADFGVFVEGMEEAANKRYKSMLAADNDKEAVRFMNLHQAKGLEAKVVILAAPTEERHLSAEYHIQRTGGTSPVGYFGLVTGDGYNKNIIYPRGWTEMFEKEKKYLEAERIRLLYVAATRAAEYLIISDSGKRHPWRELISDLPLLNEAMLTEDKTEINKAEAEAAVAYDNGSVQPYGIDDSKEKYSEGWAERASFKSFSVVSPSLLDKEAPVMGEKAEQQKTDTAVESVFDTAEPYGPIWGTIVHRVFELIVANRHKDVNTKESEHEALWSQYIEKAVYEILEQEDTDSKSMKLLLLSDVIPQADNRQFVEIVNDRIKPYIIKVLKAFHESELMRRISKANMVFTEMPFELKVDKNDRELYRHLKEHIKDIMECQEDQFILVTGIIDLVFKDNNGWMIVDYKTNRPKPGCDFKEILIRNYTPQLKAYKLIFERLTAQKVVKMQIYSTHAADCYNIE